MAAAAHLHQDVKLHVPKVGSRLPRLENVRANKVLTMLASTLAVTLAIWFVLSALNQIDPISKRLGPYDPLGLLPRWTFFAPHPGIYDYHLIYRECASLEPPLTNPQMFEEVKHLVGPWTQVPGLCPGSSRFMLWNPQRRVTKTISDIVAGMTMLRLAYPTLGDGVQYTTFYWLLLHLIQQTSQRQGQRQFALIQSHGFPPDRESLVFFMSNFHPVGASR